MPSREIPVNRWLLGMLAIGFFLSAAFFGLAPPPYEQDSLAGPLLRIAIVLGTLWLALPAKLGLGHTPKISPTTLVIVIGILIAVVRIRVPLPYLILGAIAAAIALVVLRPRPNRGRRSRV